jgi:hypothetical protein
MKKVENLKTVKKNYEEARRLKCARYAHILDRRMALNDIICKEKKSAK